MRKFVLCHIILVSVVLCGCSYTVSLNPNITPTANIANPIGLSVGLFIPEETKSLTTADRPNWAYKYTFQLGPSLESIITHATKRVFSSVQTLESYPTSRMITDRQLDIAVIAKVTSAMTTLNQKPGFFSSDADGNTSISVQLTFYTREMVQLASIIGSGVGIASESWVLSTGKKEFSKSVESSIRNLGDDLVQQMYGNYDIRKMAENTYNERRLR